MYEDTVGPEVSCLLSHYTRTGLLTLLPWRLDMQSQKEIRTEGLFAALNDCLYRNMGSVEYLVMIDLDELIIPYQVLKLTRKNFFFFLFSLISKFFALFSKFCLFFVFNCKIMQLFSTI